VSEQLDIFAAPLPDEGELDEPAGPDETPQPPRRTQLTELPGATFEEIFGDAA
jgi:hypothetical protein